MLLTSTLFIHILLSFSHRICVSVGLDELGLLYILDHCTGFRKRFKVWRSRCESVATWQNALSRCLDAKNAGRYQYNDAAKETGPQRLPVLCAIFASHTCGQKTH